MIFTEGGQEWIEVTSTEDRAVGVRCFMRGKTIEPAARLALLQERCFMLAEKWIDLDPEAMPTPQHFADELKRILT